MPCSICIDELKYPVSLPCGHIFCKDCILRAVEVVKPYAPVHFCPTCRSPYTTLNVDPNLIPSHLRLHILPSLRRVYLDESNTRSGVAMSHKTAISECASLQAENTALKINCSLWRKRAEAHAGATLGLLSLVRGARDQAVKWKTEKEELENQLNILKRKLESDNNSSYGQCSSISKLDAPNGTPPAIDPVFFSSCSCIPSYPDIAMPENNCKRPTKRLKTESSPAPVVPLESFPITSQQTQVRRSSRRPRQ